MSEIEIPRVNISFRREEIPINTLSPSQIPDEKWRYVDLEGHGHFWDGEKLPTLSWFKTGTTWVGDEYDHQEIAVGEYRCRQCSEVIEPKRRSDYSPRFVPSMVTITVAVEGEEFILTEEMYARSIEKWVEALREIVYA